MLTALGTLALQFASTQNATDQQDNCHAHLLRIKLQRQARRRKHHGKAGGSRREQEVRHILCSLTPGEHWLSVRPEWLRSPYTNRKLEIDCYSSVLNVAVEVQGEHHFSSKYIDQKEYLAQQKRDQMKRILISAHGTALIAVPCVRDLPGSQLEAWLAQAMAMAIKPQQKQA